MRHRRHERVRVGGPVHLEKGREGTPGFESRPQERQRESPGRYDVRDHRAARGRTHDPGLRLAAPPHDNLLRPGLEGSPVVGVAIHRPVEVDAFDDEVRVIDLRVRERPCDMPVESDDDAGGSRDREARDGEVRILGRDGVQVPGGGCPEGEVHVVREQWSAIRGARPRQRPRVRGVEAEAGEKDQRVGGRNRGRRSGGVRTRWNRSLRRGEAGWRSAGRERVLEDGGPPGRVSGPQRPPVLRVERRERGHPVEFLPPVGEIQRHDAADRDGRPRAPRLWFDAEDEELRGPGAPPARDAGVDTLRVRLEESPLRLRHVIEFAARRRPDVQRTHEAVRVDGGRAEELGQTSARDPLEELHLPQPVGGVQEALNTHDVEFGPGGDRGNRPLIERDRDGRCQPREDVPAGSRLHGSLQLEPRKRRENPHDREAGREHDSGAAPKAHRSGRSVRAGDGGPAWSSAWRSET